jgi:hypothetical protein
MKLTNYLILMLAAMLLASGCPSNSKESAGEDASTDNAALTATAQPADVASAKQESAAADTAEETQPAEATAEVDEVENDTSDVAAEENTSSAEASAESAPQASTESDAIGSGLFELGGLRIGIAPAAYRLHYDSRPDMALFPTWIEQSRTGVVAANLASGSVSFGEVAYFLDGELVGMMRHVEEAAVDYADFTNEIERRFGPPTDDPPRWARVAPFFAGYQKPDPGLIMKFWGNSQTREVFFASRNNTLGTTDYMLCDVDRFDVVSQQLQNIEQPR